MKQREMEQRTFGVQLRDDAGAAKITGYAAVFNSLSVEMWGFREKIAPGAFAKTIKESDVRALWNHDTGMVLGRSKAGTLTLAEDATGLAVEIMPPDCPMLESMRRGDVDQMSFGFEAIRDMWEEDRANDIVTRTLLEVRLFEVSVVTFPAYEATSAQVASSRAIERAKEIRGTFLLVNSTEQITKPSESAHLADYRRMSIELALRSASFNIPNQRGTYDYSGNAGCGG